MIENYKVYMHTSPSNKVYIGITCKDVKRRWRKDGNGYKGQEYFYKAIQKYKWDNFKHEVLYEGLTKEEAEKIEIELIKKYKSNDPNYGYNILSGGFAPGEMPDEVKQKVSMSRKGKYTGYRSPDVGIAISNAKMGHVHSDTTKEKISTTLKGRYLGKDNPTSIPIRCIETGEEFESARMACLKYNIQASNMCHHLKGRKKSVNKLHFEYINNVTTNND